MLRETFRFLSGDMGGQMLIILSDNEIYLYNLFYAGIATAIGFSFTLKFIFSGGLGRATKQRFRVRNVVNNQNFFRWSFLFWFGKMTVILGIWYLVFPLQFDIDFLKDASFFLLVLPIVVFTNSWLGLHLILGKKSILYFFASFVIFLILSSIFALKHFIPKGTIEEKYKVTSVEYAYDLELPRTEYLDRIRRISLAIDLYVVLDFEQNNKTKIFFGDERNEIDLDQLKVLIERKKEEYSSVEGSILTYNLIVDKRVKLKYVKDIVHNIRKCGYWGVQYSTGVKHSKYPSYYSGFKNLGIHEYLPPYDPKLEVFLDSIESLDFIKYKISPTASDYFRVPHVQKVNRVVVRRDAHGVLINNESIEIDEIQNVIKLFIKKYSPNCVIVYMPDYNISYGDYIEIKDILYTQIEKLRNEYSIVQFGKPYNKNFRGDLYDSARRKFPLNVVEWTKEEQRLIKLLNRKN
ncbi:hypothetical protein [Reichenbachiella faecimaris]|nr:hypothetical protein [Reichenbachiella faecimaris]